MFNLIKNIYVYFEYVSFCYRECAHDYTPRAQEIETIFDDRFARETHDVVDIRATRVIGAIGAIFAIVGIVSSVPLGRWRTVRARSCSLSKTLQGHGRWGRRQPSSSGATEFTGKHPPHLHDSVDGLVDGYRISISSKDEVGAYEGG